MVERNGDLEERCVNKEGLETRLNRHPRLKARLEGLLDIVDNAGGDLEKASATEQRVIEELRRMGNDALHCWAEAQERNKSERLKNSDTDVNKKAKKKRYWHTCFGTIEVFEQTYASRCAGKIIRPFSCSAEVSCRGYSLPLQRAITDFGAEVPFHKISAKLYEHYGIDVPVSSSRLITENHAGNILTHHTLQTEIPEKHGVDVLIEEVDGCMIPIVKTAEQVEDGQKLDRRTTREVEWKEARLCFARPKDTVTPIFGVTIGPPEEAGKQMAHCAIRAGLGSNTKVHGVGDGAPWSADQMNMVFGPQGSYLIDLYHLCEYLAAAGDAYIPRSRDIWLERQKELIKSGHISEVLKELEMHLEPDTVPDKSAPVRACHRYISNRDGQFDYKSALEAGLPVGSGEIESAHRYVIQDRLKRSGAWWKIGNAQSMLALRVARANNDWDSYWQEFDQEAA